MKNEKNSEEPARKKIRINYFYFGFFFLFLASIQVYHVFTVAKGSFSQEIFVVDAILQTLLEVLLLAGLENLIRRFVSKFLAHLFVAATFLLFLLQVIDFPLVKLVGMSVWYAINFVSDETFSNLLEMLYATNISLVVWAFFGLLMLTLPFIGVWLFHIGQKRIRDNRGTLSYGMFGGLLGSLFCALLAWDAGMVKEQPLIVYEGYQKALPWKRTILCPDFNSYILVSSLKGSKSEHEIVELIKQKPLNLEKKPNIFLFIIESLREDYVDEKIAPNLFQFKTDNVSFDLAFSNANATQLSWFSIFFSKLPFYWSKFQEGNWKSGSTALKLLEKAGYQIHVYSSCRLSYYGMDQLMFGQNLELAHTFDFFPHESEDVVFASDAAVLEKVQDDMRLYDSSTGGHMFIIFLDSTHFGYSWPHDEPLRFQPIVEEMNYFSAAYSQDNLEGIKNRYRNAFYYVDSLFDRFQKTLNETRNGPEAVVILTGDHGEEFYEKGHMFHASDLSHEQTNVPLYYKFGKEGFGSSCQPCKMTSHIDIFPTVFHYLFKESNFEEFFDGESVFAQKKWPFTVSTRYNASRNPYEFFIHNGTHKLIARFNNEKEIFKSKELYLLWTKDLADETVPHSHTGVKDHFGEALDFLFTPQ